MPGIIRYINIALVLLIMAGCGGKAGLDSYMREEVPLDFIKKVAILPLENNTDQKHAHKLVRDVIHTQILAMGLFDVVDRGIVDNVLHEEAVDPGEPLSRMMLQRIGKRLGVQAVVMGAVDMAGTRRVGSVSIPEASITLRLLETKSGTILWQASGHNDGDSIVGRLFGISPPDMYEVTRELVEKLLYTVPERVEPAVGSGG